jgi:hypothetical protein
MEGVAGGQIEARQRGILRELEVQPADVEAAPRLNDVRALGQLPCDRRLHVDARRRQRRQVHGVDRVAVDLVVRTARQQAFQVELGRLPSDLGVEQ